MKRIFFNLLTRLCLLMALIIVFSCDNVAQFDDEESQSSPIAPRVKDFLSKVSTESVVVNDNVTFTDLSLGVDERTWTFEGGDPSESNDPVVSVSFASPGLKNCSLEILFDDGSVEIKNYTILVMAELSASFTNNPILPNVPTTFTNTSIGGADQFSWVFPGGSPATSNDENPIVTWSTERDVVVSLTATRTSDGATITYQLPTSVGPPNLWDSAVQGFEDQSTTSVWSTWDGGATWPSETLTSIPGGANGTARTGVVPYNGQSTWFMITRDYPQANTTLIAGKTYKLSFWIRSVIPTTLAYLRLTNNEPNYFDIGTKYNVSVTTNWEYHEDVISITQDGTNAYPDIGFNNSDGPNTFFIDEIRLQQLD